MHQTLSKSMEDYLETIYILTIDKKGTRVKDIAEALNVTLPSVVSALAQLKKYGLVSQKPYGKVELTSDGRQIAEQIYSRHVKICTFLNQVLDVPLDIAQEDACKMEHVLHKVTMDKIVAFMEFIHNGPEQCKAWLDSFKTGNTTDSPQEMN